MFNTIKQKTELGVLKTRVGAMDALDRLEGERSKRRAERQDRKRLNALEKELTQLQRQLEIEELKARLVAEQAEHEIIETNV